MRICPSSRTEVPRSTITLMRLIHCNVIARCHALPGSCPGPNSLRICSTDGTPIQSKECASQFGSPRLSIERAMVVLPAPDAPVSNTSEPIMDRSIAALRGFWSRCRTPWIRSETRAIGRGYARHGINKKGALRFSLIVPMVARPDLNQRYQPVPFVQNRPVLDRPLVCSARC
jgi:hypothetical protein